MTDGLERAKEIIEKEMERARTEFNMPLMVLGMSQVEMLIEEEIKKYRKKQY